MKKLFDYFVFVFIIAISAIMIHCYCVGFTGHFYNVFW